jgi:hypothetical protein
MKTKTEAQEIFQKHYSAWESDGSRMISGYAYESTFLAMISTGVVPKGKNEKKSSKRA